MARRPVERNVELSRAQKSKPCLICGDGGRTIGHMGDKELNYCGHHRKYGERVLNFLINSVFQYKLSEFLKETKHDLFMTNLPELSQEDYDKLARYVNSKIVQLDEINEWHQKTKGPQK
jgi:hypothetical protein